MERPNGAPGHGSGEIVVRLARPVQETDGVALSDALRDALADRDGAVVICDVAALAPASLAALDALARLALAARRLGCSVRLRNASPYLCGLIALAGLADVLPTVPASVEPGRQTEEREEPSRIEEEGDP